MKVPTVIVIRKMRKQSGCGWNCYLVDYTVQVSDVCASANPTGRHAVIPGGAVAGVALGRDAPGIPVGHYL